MADCLGPEPKGDTQKLRNYSLLTFKLHNDVIRGPFVYFCAGSHTRSRSHTRNIKNVVTIVCWKKGNLATMDTQKQVTLGTNR